MSNLQPVDECERRDIFTVIGHLGKLILEVADVRLETATVTHFDSDEAVVVLIGLSAGGILGDKCLDYLLKVERMQRQIVEPIQGHPFQTGWKMLGT